ncbi:MAG TPA: glycosyltransferase family 87 protein [Candidatus Acidoferrum sp.]|nr:glycosyltransferase family 87 protein [Candidatus Acidoferrum sp.]
MEPHGESPTLRRAGVFRRAIRRETSRLHDRRRLLAMALLIAGGAIISAFLLARGDSAGSDARAYWAAVRIWLNGGDPYHPAGPFLPYVYAPWMLPIFTPWALLPWDVAWVVWRGGAILLLLWSLDWAYRRRPLATAVLFALLGFSLAANLDTGNITLYLAFGLWGAQFAGPRLAGLLWGLATWMKWVPAPFWIILAPRARSWGLIWLGAAGALSLATLPLTIVQIQALFGFGARPIRLDYLVLLWAVVPWWWRHPDPVWFLRPSRWPGLASATRAGIARLRGMWQRDPALARASAQRGIRLRLRAFLGLEPSQRSGS